MIRQRLRNLGNWARAALFTLLIHGSILYLVFFGISFSQEKIKAAGKPVQAVVIDQSAIEKREQEKARKLEELERQRKAEEQKLAEEKKRKEEEERQRKEEEKRQLEEVERKEQARKKRESILSNCEKLVLEEERSGKVNHDLDGLCEEERKRLADQRAAEKQKKAEQKKKQEAEAEKKRKAEEERKRKEAEEKKRKEAEEKKRREEEARRKAEAEKKRKAEAEKKRKAEERRRAEQALQARLAAEQQARLAAQTEQAASDALSAAAGRIRAAIENNWRRPATSRQGLKAVILLRVGRSGDVQSVKIVRSSGDPFFDQSAEVAVKKASPLPIPTEPKYYEHIKEFQIEFNPDE